MIAGLFNVERYRERVAAEVERRWQEAEEWAAACAKGDCRYAQPSCAPTWKNDTPKCFHDHVCLGYRGTKYLERGVPLMRYGLCQRKAMWWKGEQVKIREERKRHAAARKATIAAREAPAEDWNK